MWCVATLLAKWLIEDVCVKIAQNTCHDPATLAVLPHIQIIVLTIHKPAESEIACNDLRIYPSKRTLLHVVAAILLLNHANLAKTKSDVISEY